MPLNKLNFYNKSKGSFAPPLLLLYYLGGTCPVSPPVSGGVVGATVFVVFVVVVVVFPWHANPNKMAIIISNMIQKFKN